MAKVDASGRSKSEHHVRLYRWLTGSDAWQATSGNAIKLLIYIATFELGDNNVKLFMSERKAAEGIGVDRKTARKLLRELQEKGFLVCTAPGSFNAKRSPAAQWRLTWKSWPDRSQGPTHDYRRWKSKEKVRGEKLPNAGGEIPHCNGRPTLTGGRTPPLQEQEPQKTADHHLGKSGPQSLAIGRGESRRDLRGDLDFQFSGGPIAAGKAA